MYRMNNDSTTDLECEQSIVLYEQSKVLTQ